MYKRMLAVAVADVAVEGEYEFERRMVGTSPNQLRALAEWLVEAEVDEVVMESTAQYWRPVWETLERIKRPAAFENPPDGADGRTGSGRTGEQRPINGLRAKFAEGALVLEFAPQREDQIFGVLVGPVDRVRDMRTVSPVHPVQPLPGRAGDPALHRVKTHAMSPRDSTQGSASARHRDHMSAPLSERIFSA